MKKYKIGFVSGMFDIIHGGHIDILKQAKELCECLIVAVGTDDFIRVRKKREPVIPYDQRTEIIKSLCFVDEVVPGHDLDKVKAYYKYHFDVMVAGDDHKSEPIYIEAVEKLKTLEVDTIYIPHKYDISSTDIRKKIIENFGCLK